MRLGVRIQKGDEGVRRESPFPNHLDPLFRGDDGRSRGRRTGLGGGETGGGVVPSLRPVNHWGPTRQPLEGQREDMRPAEDL